MRSIRFLALTAVSISMIFCLLSCSPSAPYQEPDHTFPDPIEAVATDISLEIRASLGGSILDTLYLATEGQIEIILSGVVYEDQIFDVYVRAEGFYTKLYSALNGTTITVDLDSVPEAPRSITGVIFGFYSFLADFPLADHTIRVSSQPVEGTPSTYTTLTDDQGRWGLKNLPTGDYLVSFTYEPGGTPQAFEIGNLTSGVDYEDHLFHADMEVDAPNIYLYPETQSDISVSLSFPSGGYIIVSDPPYNTGWNVNVTPEGIIDGHFDYLFYEARVTMDLQSGYGWMLSGDNLESDLRQVLHNYGFRGREIDDFIDFWLPEVSGFPWYAMCPQAPEQMSTLRISPEPDNILRALFTIRPMFEPVNMVSPPEDPFFTRTGFTVVEWGVIDWRRPQ